MYFFLFPSIGGALQNSTLWSVLNQTALFLHAGSFLQRLAKSAEAGAANIRLGLCSEHPQNIKIPAKAK